MTKQKEMALTIPAVFMVGSLEINKEKLQALIAEDTKLVINGVSDTAGYKSAIAKRAEYRTLRTSLEKHRKDLSKPLQDYLKDLKSETDSLGELAYTGEEYFTQQLIAVDEEKDRIRKEKELEAQRKVNARIFKLMSFGMTYEEDNYFCSYEPALIITVTQVKEYTDGDFNDFIAEVEDAFRTEETRVEQIRLQREQDEIDRLAEVERQQQIADNNAESEKRLQEKQIKLRSKELTLMGAVVDEDVWTLNGNEISLEDITSLDDDAWDAVIDRIGNAMQAPVDEIEPITAPFYSKMGYGTENDDSGSQIAIDGNTGFAPAPEELASFAHLEVSDEIVKPLGLPISSFYASEVVDYGDKVKTFDELKEWACEELIDQVRQETPHGEMGATENTMCFKFEEKFYEIKITQIDWNRYDKQFYFIEMFSEPNLEVKEVVVMPGTPPILEKTISITFGANKSFIIHNFQKSTMRIFPAEYESEANDGVAPADIIDAGMLSETDLQYLLIKKPK